MNGNHARIWTLIMALLVAVLAGPAGAQQLTAPQRVEFNKLVQQRNKLHVQLHRLDVEAATLLKDGRDATVVHARQISTQDQLDLVELRLALLATRHGLGVPPPPEINPQAEGSTTDPEAARRIEKEFSRGRNRTVDLLRADGLRFLASLDFESFLKK